MSGGGHRPSLERPFHQLLLQEFLDFGARLDRDIKLDAWQGAHALAYLLANDESQDNEGTGPPNKNAVFGRATKPSSKTTTTWDSPRMPSPIQAMIFCVLESNSRTTGPSWSRPFH